MSYHTDIDDTVLFTMLCMDGRLYRTKKRHALWTFTFLQSDFRPIHGLTLNDVYFLARKFG